MTCLQTYNALPPDLNPLINPEMLLDPVNSPLARFDREVNMEAAIMQNLDAAARDMPKPNRLPAAAGGA